MEAMQKVTSYKSRRWKWIVPLLLLAVAAGIGGYRYFTSDKNAEAYRFVAKPVTKGDLNLTVSATGYLEPLEKVEVGTEVSGTIEKVFVDYNDVVKKGQLLAQMDKTKYQSAVDRAQAALLSAKATLANAKADLFGAEATVNRNKMLRKNTKGSLPSKSDWDTAWAAYLSAKAQIENGKAQVEQARHSLVSAQYDLARTSVYSPINGIVLNRNVDPGQTVAASFQTPVLFTIAKDLRKMELQVSIDEADIAKVKAGQQATFTVDAYPDAVFKGTIRMVRVNSQIEEGVVTYIAVLDIDNADLRLRPGMSADADITVRHFKNVLLVPRAALLYTPVVPKETKLFAFRNDDQTGYDPKPHVWRLEGQTPEKLYVKLLGSDATMSAVSSDTLKAGDRVVVAQEKQQ
jgi:HlyD family secretion protein